ncbi:MAG: DUF4139 domain-containing protein [candidate division Zixibacteria bacterium]|nr:DUF4139 domain-containing protein [candidate division Zixibacteria bacterium]
MRRLLTLLVVAVAAAWNVSQAGVQITIYNNDLALVKDNRSLEFKKGQFEFSFTDVASAIDPTSVAFTVPGQAKSVTLLEQNYRYDLVSSEKVLQKYLDRSIQVLTRQDKMLEGTLLAFDPSTLTLKTPSSGLRIINRDQIADLSLGATISPGDDYLDLGGWVSIDNRSGAAYNDATVKLIAGDVHRIEQPRLPMMLEKSMGAAADGSFTEKQFFEYHLYTLQRPATLRDNEIKQLSLFEPARVTAKKLLTYDGGSYGAKVRVMMEFQNSAAAGLGIPLPAGKIRVMKVDTDGSLEFIGEDAIGHTPKDEKVRVVLGNAFDVVGERVSREHRQISRNTSEDDVEITLRNHKETSVAVLVVEHFWGDWTITQTSSEYVKKDARTAEWTVSVPKDGELKLQYTVRQVQ